MTTSDYLSKLNKVEKIACSSKWNRLLSNPYRYISTILFNQAVYPIRKKEKLRTTRVFFDLDMLVGLPASTDIYLTGGKSHDSEIRLARYLILTLEKGQSFLDIGAHYGYFTLLAATLVGKNGHVQCYEPSRRTFDVLKQNCEKNGQGNIDVFHKAVSDKNERITFYEFPNLYSEYNAGSVEQFSGEAWFKAYKPEMVTIEARTIDSMVQNDNFYPDVIKIDVEGAEYKVISGAAGYLSATPQIVMEYLCADRENEQHRKAAALLQEKGFIPHIITKEGKTIHIQNIEAHLSTHNLESDNIVFKKLQ